MPDSWDSGLKTPVNGLLHKNFKFGPLFGYHNFQNQIDTWETTVRHPLYLSCASCALATSGPEMVPAPVLAEVSNRRTS